MLHVCSSCGFSPRFVGGCHSCSLLKYVNLMQLFGHSDVARETYKASVPLTELDVIGVLVRVRESVTRKSEGAVSSLSERQVSSLVNSMRAVKLEDTSLKPYMRIVNSPCARAFYNMLSAAHYFLLPFPLSLFFKDAASRILYLFLLMFSFGINVLPHKACFLCKLCH